MKRRLKGGVRGKQPKVQRPISKVVENVQGGRSKRGVRNGEREIYLPEILPATRTGKKISPVELLESAVAVRRKSQTELADLGKLLAEKSARLAALETTGDPNDAAVLTELVQLQISTGLLPRRIAVKEECDANAEQALTQATNQFIREHLGPRVRRLAARTREIVKSKLSSHLRDPAALLVAVEQSEYVRTIESLALPATDQPHRGALVHAEGALTSWAAVDKFETTHLTESQTHHAVERGAHASRV